MNNKLMFLAQYGTEKQHNEILDSGDRDAIREVSHNPDLSHDSISRAFSGYDDFAKRCILNNSPNVTEKHLSQIFDSNNRDDKQQALEHKKLNSSHLTQIFNDKDIYTATAAISHPLVNKDHIELALKSKNASLRWGSISHDNATKEQLERHTNDPDEEVAWTAQDKLKRKKYL